uniref:VOC family protein n=1 Tax=Bifidobacterium adolescentis TaxID=1680 RepID=UPI003FF09606
MAKPMTAFTTDLQHSGMIAKDLDETIKFYREVMGFELAGLFMNGENRCAFLRYGHLTIETWEGDPAPMTTGAIRPQRRDHRILPDCGGVVAPMRPIRAQYACR